MNRTKWLGHEIDENGFKPNEEKVEAILKLKPPENTKELESFLGAIQYMAKYLPKLSERTDRLRKLLKKNEQWKWGPEQETDFNRIKHAYRRSMLGTLRKRKRQYSDNRRQHNRAGNNTLAKTR